MNICIIGVVLNNAFDQYDYETAAAVLLIIILIVMFVEYTSGFVRNMVK